MKIQKISFYKTQNFPKTYNTTKTTLKPCVNKEYQILNTLDALSLNVKSSISFTKASLDIEYLKSVKPKVRISKLQKKNDTPVPNEFSIHNRELTKMEENALFAWKYGMFSENNQQKDFDKSAQKRNLQEWVYIKTLDDLIENAKPLEENHIVYRGLFGSMDYQSDFINSIEEDTIIPHQSYVATATKLTDYTKHFLETEAIAVMRIKLPSGTKGILMNKEADEFVLPRGTELKINSIDKKYGIIEAEYILPTEFPKVPDFVEEYYQKMLTKQTK